MTSSANRYAANGNAAAAGTFGFAGGAAKGIMAGAAFGPYGMLAGAVIGGVDESLKNLATAAENAAVKINALAAMQSQQIKKFHEAEKYVALQKEIEGVASETND